MSSFPLCREGKQPRPIINYCLKHLLEPRALFDGMMQVSTDACVCTSPLSFMQYSITVDPRAMYACVHVSVIFPLTRAQIYCLWNNKFAGLCLYMCVEREARGDVCVGRGARGDVCGKGSKGRCVWEGELRETCVWSQGRRVCGKGS